MVFKQQVRIGLNPLRRVFLHLIDRLRLAICALKSLIISMYRCTVQIYSIAVEANMKVELTIDRTKELPKGAVPGWRKSYLKGWVISMRTAA